MATACTCHWFLCSVITEQWSIFHLRSKILLLPTEAFCCHADENIINIFVVIKLKLNCIFMDSNQSDLFPVDEASMSRCL